ncbi:retropepsin-like domain-containing protein, partial [bacterium]|nr:retropepsin-like domain-containing protein [bacterium]
MRRCIAISATVIFLALVSYARLPGEQSSGQELLQQVKQALRAPGKAWVGTMVSGKAVRGGVDHAYSFAFLPDGRFVQSFQGPDSKTLGNDGRQYWQEDYSHFVQELDFGDRDRQMAINLLLSDNWLFASAPIQLTADEGIVHVLLKETGVTVDIHLDPGTHLPTDASFQIPGGTTLKLSDWRVAGDRRVPMHVEVTTDGETETYIAGVARPIRPGDVQPAIPKQNVSDFTFDPAKPATVESSFVGKTHIMVRALVNGQDVGWFILDSGAGAMVIDKVLADSLHLERLSRGSASGVGGTFESSARAVDRFEIGPMTMRNVRFGDYDFSSFNRGPGPRIAGTIGTPIFRRGVVAMNWKGPTLEIYDRARFTLEKGAWQRLRFSSDNPAVLARVAGTPESWYRLDSGAAGFLTLHTPFVEKWKLLEGRETKESSSTGMGGTVTARTGTIEWFEFGSRRFNNPTVVFSTATIGTFTDPYLAGNIGIDVLKSFTVVFDFTGSRA